MIRSPSLTVGTRPLGLRLRYSGSRLPPNGPPTSRRSNGRSSSAQHHSTFWTLEDVDRPQIFSMEGSWLAAVIISLSLPESATAQVPNDPPPLFCDQLD